MNYGQNNSLNTDNAPESDLGPVPGNVGPGYPLPPFTPSTPGFQDSARRAIAQQGIGHPNRVSRTLISWSGTGGAGVTIKDWFVQPGSAVLLQIARTSGATGLSTVEIFFDDNPVGILLTNQADDIFDATLVTPEVASTRTRQIFISPWVHHRMKVVQVSGTSGTVNITSFANPLDYRTN